MPGTETADHGADAGQDALAALHGRLDSLWTLYLAALDKYAASQAAIQRHMANAFFQLAQANFKSSGRRYGQECYDQRAVAMTRTRVASQGGTTTTCIVNHAVGNTAGQRLPESSGHAHPDNDTPAKQRQTQLPSPAPTPEPEVPTDKMDLDLSASNDQSDDKNTESQNDSRDARPQTFNSHDPLRWFGILVPSALRSAQSSFSSALYDEGSISMAVDCARRLYDLEVEIRKLRKEVRKAEKNATSEHLLAQHET